MIDLHRDLYVEHLREILSAEEEKYWQLRREYNILEEGFRNAMNHYRKLENGLQSSSGEHLFNRVFRKLQRLRR